MYEWIWRKLPFGLPGKIIGSLLLIGLAVWLLWYHVFPAVEPLLPFDDVQVEGPGQPGPGQPVPGQPGSGVGSTGPAGQSPSPTGIPT